MKMEPAGRHFSLQAAGCFYAGHRLFSVELACSMEPSSKVNETLKKNEH